MSLGQWAASSTMPSSVTSPLQPVRLSDRLEVGAVPMGSNFHNSLVSDSFEPENYEVGAMGSYIHNALVSSILVQLGGTVGSNLRNALVGDIVATRKTEAREVGPVGSQPLSVILSHPWNTTATA